MKVLFNRIESLCAILLCLSVGVLSLVTIPLTGAAETIESSSYWGTAARGTGKAYTAVSGDISGISYNPASSAAIVKGQFISDYNRLSQRQVDVNNAAVGGGIRTGAYVHSAAIYRTDLSHDFGSFDSTSSGLSLDYSDDVLYYNLGWTLNSRVQLGTNLKYFSVTSDVEDGDASGYGLDFGALYEIGDLMRFGGSVKNLIAEKTWDSGTSEDVPLEVRGGLRFMPQSDLDLGLDAVYGEEPGFRSLNIGGEWWAWRVFEAPAEPHRAGYFGRRQWMTREGVEYGLAIRAGAEKKMTGNENFNLTLGLGMQFGQGRLNYSFQQRSDFDNQHFFGFSAYFGKPTGEENNTASRASDSNRGNQENEIGESNTPSSSPSDTAGGTQSDERVRLEENIVSTRQAAQFGLFQWFTPENVEFPAEMLRDELSDLADHEIVVYKPRPDIQNAVLNDALSDAQVNRLLAATKREVLVTGRLEDVGEGFTAEAVLIDEAGRKVLKADGETLAELADSMAGEIQATL